MNFRVMLIEDAVDTQLLAKAALAPEFELVVAPSLANARDEMSRVSPDLILLDVGLPDGDGFEFCSELQSKPGFRQIPVIFLTGRSEATDKVQGFRLGAQDYLTKPFHPLELRARVEARLRHSNQSETPLDELHFENLRIDLRHYELKMTSAEGTQVREPLSALELKLLRFFVEHPGRVLSRTDLLEEVWGPGASVTDRAVDSQVSHLRKKLRPSGIDIRSVYGAGYRLERRPDAA